MERMVRWGAYCGMAGGALRIVTTFIPFHAGSGGLEAVYAATDLGMLFALIAVGLAAGDALGRIGFACWAVALAGLASIVGPDPVAFGIDFYRLGAGIFVLALGAMAVALLVRQTMLPAAGLWVASAVLALVGGATGTMLAFATAGLVLGLGFLAAGWAMLSSARRA